MKKNIIIIGHGDLGNRLTRILNDEYKVFHVSRSNKFESSNFIQWDWLSKDGLNIEAKIIDTVIFFPKPSRMDDKGYINGFINSSKNIYRELCNLPINKFISISSTRVYNKQDNKMAYESDEISTEEYRGKIIREYEEQQESFYGKKLIILRLSGLYDASLNKMSKNFIHRKNAAMAIKFFIEKDFNFTDCEIFNCSEDSANSSISNKKVKSLGFSFQQYN